MRPAVNWCCSSWEEDATYALLRGLLPPGALGKAADGATAESAEAERGRVDRIIPFSGDDVHA